MSSSASQNIQAKRQPFFNQEGQGGFFSKSKEAAPSFFSPTTVQPKLTIGQPNDKYEVEADAMADRVVQRLSLDSRPIQQMGYNGNTAIQPKCADCEAEEKLRKKENLLLNGITPIQGKPIFESNGELPEGHLQTKAIASPIVQPKCSACEEEEKVQKKGDELSGDGFGLHPKMNTSPTPPDDEATVQAKSEGAPSATPSLESRLSSNRGGGRVMSPDVRRTMGSAFGADFSGVRVHTDSSAVQMSKELKAQAFTHGSDIYFNSGKYDTNSARGKHLLAHELTHTVQQNNVTKINRKDGTVTNSSETKDEFVQRVFGKARQRLNSNLENIEKWSKYIDDQFNDLALQAQVRGQGASDLFRDATMRGRTSNFEAWCNMRRPDQRVVEEAVMTGLINGGCQYCHSSNLAWERDNRFLASRGFSGFDALPSPKEMLFFDAAYSEAYRLANTHGQAIPNVEFRQFTSGEFNSNTRSLAEWIQKQEADQINGMGAGPLITSGNSVPAIPEAASSDVPYKRSGLCNDAPSKGEAIPVAPNLNPSSVGPCTVTAFAAIAKIRPVLEPLGTSGYRVLPRDVFSRLYDSPPSTVRTLVHQNILVRKQQYYALLDKINNRSINYLELCRIVDELLPTTNKEVREQVVVEKLNRDLRRSVLDAILIILSLASLLLMFLFPPAGLLLGALVGGALIGKGSVDLQRGIAYKQGMGAGIFTRGQEESANALIVGGIFDIVMGAITAGTSVMGMGKLGGKGTSPGQAIQGKSTTPGKGGWTSRQTPAGEMWTNPNHPDVAVWRNGTNFEVSNAAGEIVAFGEITPNGYWAALGKRPAGALPSPQGATGAAAESSGIVPATGQKIPVPLSAGSNPTVMGFYQNPQKLWGYSNAELESILVQEGWTAKPYTGTSTAYEYILETPAGRKSIVVNYGGGRHTHGMGSQVFEKPFYYKITGGNIKKTKVIDPNVYPASDMAKEKTFRFIDGNTGKTLKE